MPYFKIKEYKKIDNLPQRLYPIDSLQKVISLGHLYRHPNFKHKNYSVNVKGLYQMIPALQKLNGLVGLEKIKRKVIDQIMFFSQDLHNQEWYYYQQQKLLAQQYEQDQGHFHHPLRPPPRGNHHGPRHPLETLLQIIPFKVHHPIVVIKKKTKCIGLVAAEVEVRMITEVEVEVEEEDEADVAEVEDAVEG